VSAMSPRKAASQYSGRPQTGPARARIIAAEFLDQFGVDAHDAVAALDAGLARGNPRRRLLVGSKGRSGVTIAVHGILLSGHEQQDRSEHGRQVPANISGHSTALDKQQSRPTRGM